MKVKLSEEELYPVYFLGPQSSDRTAVEIPEDLISRYNAAFREFEAAREEIGKHVTIHYRLRFESEAKLK